MAEDLVAKDVAIIDRASSRNARKNFYLPLVGAGTHAQARVSSTANRRRKNGIANFTCESRNFDGGLK